MNINEAVNQLKEYKEKIAKQVESYSPEQRAIDALTLSILDGDVNQLKEYKKKIAKQVEAYSPEQRAIDALHLVLLADPKGKGLLNKL